MIIPGPLLPPQWNSALSLTRLCFKMQSTKITPESWFLFPPHTSPGTLSELHLGLLYLALNKAIVTSIASEQSLAIYATSYHSTIGLHLTPISGLHRWHSFRLEVFGMQMRFFSKKTPTNKPSMQYSVCQWIMTKANIVSFAANYRNLSCWPTSSSIWTFLLEQTTWYYFGLFLFRKTNSSLL